MAKGSQILTANRLTDGTVLYWHGGQWTEALGEAEVFENDAAGKAALEAAAAFVKGRVVVNPYLFDVRIEAGVAAPVKEREIIRAAGPSVRRDLGKQASGQYRAPPVHSQVTRATESASAGEAKDCFDVSL